MYKVNFVGLVCFLKQPDGSRLALMPDGRSFKDVEPHVFRLVVGKKRVLSPTSGWPVEERLSGVFNLPPCTIDIQGTSSAAVNLDRTQHDAVIPSLQGIDPTFTINTSTAVTVGRIAIRQGTLKAYRYPHSNPLDSDVALVSQLRVPHDQSITVTVLPDDPRIATKTITLQASTEIVIANASRPFEPPPIDAPEHFQIYAQLASAPVNFANAVLRSLGPRPDVLFSSNPYFPMTGDIALHAECGNTGCCP